MAVAEYSPESYREVCRRRGGWLRIPGPSGGRVELHRLDLDALLAYNLKAVAIHVRDGQRSVFLPHDPVLHRYESWRGLMMTLVALAPQSSHSTPPRRTSASTKS